MAEPRARSALSRILSRIDHDLDLGYLDGAGAPISIPYSVRSAHLHVIGEPRSGKSRFLADLIQQDIVNGQGLTLLDPHGELFDVVTGWMAENEFMFKRRKNIHPIDLGDRSSTFIYNPLHINHIDESYRVAGNVVGAITSIYGGDEATATPLIDATLNTVCTILAQRRLPLAAAQYLLIHGHKEIRRNIIEGTPDEYYRHHGDELLRKSPREFSETVESSERRLRKFIGNPMVRRIFSQTENALNFRQVMDERHVLLLNAKLNPYIGQSELRAIGMLCVNNLVNTAFMRDPESKPHPHYLYIDEVQNYLSGDIEDIINQASKFGLFLTLAHQTLGHLLDAGEAIYRGVMTGTLLKAVFRIPMLDAEVLCDELFSNEVDYELVKEKLKTPHAVGVVKDTLRSTHRARAMSESLSESDTDSEGDGVVDGSSESMYIPNNPAIEAAGITQGLNKVNIANRGHAHATGRALTTTNSFGESVAETFRPLYEWFSTQTVSLEEQRYRFKTRLKWQSPRHFYLAMRGEGTIGLTARDVPDPYASPEKRKRLVARFVAESPWIVNASDVREVKELPALKSILDDPGRLLTTPEEPDDWLEPDLPPPGKPS